jgi:hypothetical protein
MAMTLDPALGPSVAGAGGAAVTAWYLLAHA